MTRRRRPLDSPPPALGSVRADEALPLAELARRFGWREQAKADASKRGLRVIRYGKMKYCLGSDVIKWLESLASEQGGDHAENP